MLVGGGAMIVADLTSGVWRRGAKLICGLSFEGACDVETEVGPIPTGGKAIEWMSAADHVEM
jgi:hypothetical protein